MRRYPMENVRWQKIVEIFENALDIPEDERAEYLKTECVDSEMHDEVAAMLAADSSAEDFIESPILANSSLSILKTKQSQIPELDRMPEESLIGSRIGAFKLISEVGRGGMGAVYLAERADGEFEQHVAIKLIKRGMDSDFIIQRFRHERQILANLEHPHIARLFDGGTTAHGSPYLVMEFIEGSTLYEYCDAHKMTIIDRLKVFQMVCSAVSFAHSKQVIHRDIKPNNILITKNGVPKLLDFGIAKILDPNLIHESVSPTASMMRLLTPDYASPEQIRGDDVTHASDIYSLGILLYELLTGHRPFNLAKLSLYDISRIICEENPETPSNIFSKSENLLSIYNSAKSKSVDFAKVRQSNLDALKDALSPNLDRIILKSLAKDASSRYLTVDAFSADISKHLRGEKITAENVALQSTKSFEHLVKAEPRQNSKSLAVLPFRQLNLIRDEDTGEKFLGMGLADAITTRLSRIRRLIVRPTSSVLRYESDVVDPLRAGTELGVEYLLEGHIKRADNRMRVTVQLLDIAKNATVWATSIDETVSDIFSLEDAISTKVTEALLPHLSESELEQFSRRGTENSDAFEHYLRGRYYFNLFTEEGLAKSLVSFHNAVAEDPNYAHAFSGIADYYTWLGVFGILPPQECFRAAIETATKAVELDDQLAEAHTSLGFALHAGENDWAKAEIHLLRSLELNPNYVTNFIWLAILRFTEGQFDEGIRFAKRAIELDPFSAFGQHNLGWGLYFARRFDESIAQYLKVVQMFPTYGLGFYGLSKVLRYVGRFDEAGAAIERAIELFEQSGFAILSRIETFAAAGKKDEAITQLEAFQQTVGDRFVSPYHLAIIYCTLGDDEKAIENLGRCYEIKDSWLNWLFVEPVFDRLADEPNFIKLKQKLALRIKSSSSKIELLNFRHGQYTESENTGIGSFHNRKTLLVRESETGSLPRRERTFAKPKARKYVIATIAFVLLLSGMYWSNILTVSWTDGPRLVQPATANALTLVVLPLKTFSAADDQNIGVSVAESLSNKLGNIKRLTVISASSGRAVAEKDPVEIGRELGVGYFLRGELDNTNQRNDIIAEFVDTGTGQTIWKETFSGEGNLIDAQTKVAEKIWTTLQIEPSPFEIQQVQKGFTDNPASYEQYLIGRFQMTNRSPESLDRAINAFSQALAADSNLVLAYAGLADAYALQNLYEIPPPPDAYKNAKKNALRALSLDENLAEAHASLAYVKFYNDRDRAGAELEFHRAIQINPSYATAHHWFALALAAMNKPAESISEAKTAQTLDPVSPSIKAATAITYFYDQKYAEGIAEAEKALKINPGFVPAIKVKRWIHQANGEYEPAIAAFMRERTLSGGDDSPGWFITQAQVEALGTDRENALKKLNDAIEVDSVKNNPSAFSFEIALAFAAFGQNQKALDWLEKAEASNNHSFNSIEVDPRLAALHSDKRFAALVAKLKTAKTVSL